MYMLNCSVKHINALGSAATLQRDDNTCSYIANFAALNFATIKCERTSRFGHEIHISGCFGFNLDKLFFPLGSIFDGFNKLNRKLHCANYQSNYEPNRYLCC